MSESQSSAAHSYSSAGVSESEAGSEHGDALNALQDGGGDEDITDLLEGNRGLREAMFRVVFNTGFSWAIQRDNWAFKAIRPLLFRLLIIPLGYKSYVTAVYVISALIVLSLALAVWLVGSLQMLTLVMWSIAWVSIMDYLIFMANCQWTHGLAARNVAHAVFTDQNCLAMPHLVHMVVAGLVALLLGAVVMLMAVGECDLNPLTRSLLAAPDGTTASRVVALKMVMVILSTVITFSPTNQCVIMVICAGLITLQLLSSVPYYCDWINLAWVGLWCGIVYTCVLLNIIELKGLAGTPAAHTLTWAVLWGIFPSVLLGAAASAARLQWLRRPLARLHEAQADPESLRDPKHVYLFSSPWEVEILSRSMRRWDWDGVPVPEATEFGEFVLMCGMARHPGNSALLISYANFFIEARHDAQNARTQLQLATKAGLGPMEELFHFKTQVGFG
ncbi:hypothetical protein MNEG_10408 [Monoraphidium neglectum]|uniref:Uncharacterized protein n=1 Tax=Monoraphidium neglectum TaxID=145388 RepID=A0A0D2MSR9_9CHLO|nr:hypothetical protein MNEG_10408 [Monoraphidium neglectum]KIY97555.1 hypothetical protein MNEG_10408 [Monoraphidium neglectum]|eukprot:XP_013896575.1 hypothetical protein MNEG_10408 [Monoraphidium neglectum]